jgi:hypothetical protein
MRRSEEVAPRVDERADVRERHLYERQILGGLEDFTHHHLPRSTAEYPATSVARRAGSRALASQRGCLWVLRSTDRREAETAQTPPPNRR